MSVLSPAELSVHRFGTTAEVRVRGEFDLVSAPLIEQEVMSLLGGRPETLVLDLEGVTFLDSSAIAVLVRAHRRTAAMATRLVAVRPRGAAMRAIELCAVDGLFPFVDGV